MNRRGALRTLLAAVIAGPFTAAAQQADKVYRLGVLRTEARSSAPHLLTALEDGLRDRGYLAGQNLTIDYRFADGKTNRLPQLAAQLVALRPDVLIGISVSATVALKQATVSVPIVMLSFAEPVSAGLVPTLARPGGNVTGMSVEITPAIVGKQLQLLTEVAGSIRRVAVLANPAYPPTTTRRQALDQAAHARGITLLTADVSRADDIDKAFTVMGRERADGLFVFGDPLMFSLRSRIGALATRNHLPCIAQYREGADAGALMAYGPHFADAFRHLGTYVDKILKGARPGDLPIEQATRFELVINLKTARALALTVPASLLLRADDVIE